MRRYGMAAAVVLLLGVNAFALVGVACNRSGEPDAQVQLTERELYPRFSYEDSREENTGIFLELDWNRQAGMLRDVDSGRNSWFDQPKLEAVGFDCSVPPDSAHAERYYGKTLSRRTYAVIEFDGKSWREFLENETNRLAALEEKARGGEVSQKDLAYAKRTHDIKVTNGSRLFVVDVGNDAAELRSRYADRHRHIITPASVRLRLIPSQKAASKGGGARLEGCVEQVLIDQLHVPREMHPPLEAVMKQPKASPYLAPPQGTSKEGRASYSVTLRYGKHYEPWIANIQSLPSVVNPRDRGP
jgi:hypothetical protein